MQRLVIVMQCLGVAELTGGTALQYEVEVKNKFQTLESIEEETVPNLLWESTRNIMVDVAEKVIGYRKTKWVKPWITEETYSLTEDKRQARQSDLAKYKELKKVVQKSLRKDKDRYTTAMCEDLKEANDKGNMRKNVSDSAIIYSEVSSTVALHRVKVRRDGNRTDVNCSSLKKVLQTI